MEQLKEAIKADVEQEVYGTIGVCLATLVGAFTEEPKIIGQNPLYVRAAMVAMRPVKDTEGKRKRHANEVDVTASGTAAENLLREYVYGRRAFITGEMRIEEWGVSVHAAQLSWSDAGSGV